MTQLDPDTLACIELVELVTEYFDDALPPVDRARFERHLMTCDGCTTYVEQIRQTIAATGSGRARGHPARGDRAPVARLSRVPRYLSLGGC